MWPSNPRPSFRLRLFAVGLTAMVVTGSGGGAAQAAAAKPPAHVQTGYASYFDGKKAGKATASGAPAKPGAMVAASRTLPLGTTAKVVNAETGKAVNVTVVDRGPYAKRRVMDVSAKAATQLGMKKDGVARVKVQPLHLPRSGAAAR